MKRKIRMLKKLFLTISASSVLNWIMLLVGIIGMIVGFSSVFYKVMFVVLSLEVLFLDANYFEYYHPTRAVEQEVTEEESND